MKYCATMYLSDTASPVTSSWTHRRLSHERDNIYTNTKYFKRFVCLDLILFLSHLAPKLLNDIVDTLPVSAGDDDLLHLVLLATPLLSFLHWLLLNEDP